MYAMHKAPHHKFYALLIAIFLLATISLRLVYLAQVEERFVNEEQHQPFPKLIWTYWHSKDMPETVKRCIKTWEVHNPSYKITVLNEEKVKQLFGFDMSEHGDAISTTRKSDYARILAMKHQGGFWIDSSTICNKPLDWIQDIGRETNCEFFGFKAGWFTTNDRYPVIENWFFAAKPQSSFVADWCDETLSILSFKNENAYVAQRVDVEGYDVSNLRGSLPYLSMHLAASVVQQKNIGKYKLHLIDACGTNGPLEYLCEAGWHTDKALDGICTKSEYKNNMPLVKMRGDERLHVEKHPHLLNCIFNGT